MSTLLMLGVLSVFRGNPTSSLKDISVGVIFVASQRIIGVCIVSLELSRARS